MHFGEPPKSIIDYDQKCFSCSEQPKRVIQAFKMACLTYKPSKIAYDDKMMSRDAMIGHGMAVINEMERNRDETATLIKNISLSLLGHK